MNDQSNDPGKVYRLPPHSPEAEQGALGCMLIDPNEAIPAFKHALDFGAFYDLRHQELFKVMLEMHDQLKPVDLITVQQRLRDVNLLESIGGLRYMNELLDKVPSAANLEYYVEILREKLKLRRLLAACSQIISDIYGCGSEEGAADRLVDAVESRIHAIQEETQAVKFATGYDLSQMAQAECSRFADMKDGETTGIPSGWPDLDKITDGFRPGEMALIAARPSAGKTAMALNIVQYVSQRLKIPVGVFSIEMMNIALAKRLMSAGGRVNVRHARTWNAADIARARQAAMDLEDAQIFVDDTSGLDIRELKARARRMVTKHGAKLIVVDYLQLVHGSDTHRSANREREVAEVSMGMKAMAKELQIPVIVLVQLNRESDKENRRPKLSDMRDSGQIEQDADLVGMLYRPKDESKSENDQEKPIYPVNLYIAKQRDGQAGGDVKFMLNAGHQRFEQVAKVDPKDIPQGYDY